MRGSSGMFSWVGPIPAGANVGEKKAGRGWCLGVCTVAHLSFALCVYELAHVPQCASLV